MKNLMLAIVMASTVTAPAFANGCNVQAHAFAVNMDKFAAAGATIVGVSLDSIDWLRAFSAEPEYCGGKVPVVSDRGGTVARAYELKVDPAAGGFEDSRGAEVDHGLAERTTFNVDRALAEFQRLASPNRPATK